MFSRLHGEKEAVFVDRLILANLSVTDGYKTLMYINKNVIVLLCREINLSNESDCLILPL